jgi:serine/threonine-protein kinase RsbW/stage II sporulation protein AB (anti-sigma F factor)
MTCVADRRIELAGRALPDAVAPARNAAADLAEQGGAPVNVVESVRLAVSEALTNIVYHAYEGQEPGPMSLEAWLTEDALIVLVCDEGSGMRPRPDTPGLGLGLPLLAQLADDFRVEERRGGAGTRVSMRFSLDGSGTDL